MSSRVIPLFPGVWWLGASGVVIEATEDVEIEEEELSVDVMVVSVGEVLGDGLEGNDEADDLEKKPCISKRLRTFHIV